MSRLRVKPENFDKLEGLGFEVLDDIYKEDYDVQDDCYLYYYTGYVYQIGESRRGQAYYYIIDEVGWLYVYANSPEGNGSITLIDEVIFNLIQLGIVNVH